jgi:hypothetical protein
MSHRKTLTVTPSTTFSQASAAGLTHSGWLVGPTTDLSGQEAVLVSHSVPPARAKELTTLDTCGPLFGGSSHSEDLQRSLASRLRQQMDVDGSPEYDLTWKHWDMESGPPICALRASGRRISDNGCGGWQTPTVEDAGREGSLKDYMAYVEKGQTSGCRLRAQVHAAGWPTPNTNERGPESRESKDNRGAGGIDLQSTAKLAGWVTPSSRDWKDTPGMSPTGTNPDGTERTRLDQLPRQAALAGWATPVVNDATGSKYTYSGGDHEKPAMKLPGHAELASGPPASTSHAPTEKRGVLNPELPRWLLGFPAAWTCCGVTAMQSARRSPRSSSKHVSKGTRDGQTS